MPEGAARAAWVYGLVLFTDSTAHLQSSGLSDRGGGKGGSAALGKSPSMCPPPPSNLSWRCSGSKKSLKARRQKLEGMNSPNGKRTQGPNTDPAAGPDSLTFCLIGRKRGATVPTSAWSLCGERPTCREGQGLDTRAPRPFRPLLVTCVKRVQSPESLGV